MQPIRTLKIEEAVVHLNQFHAVSYTTYTCDTCTVHAGVAEPTATMWGRFPLSFVLGLLTLVVDGARGVGLTPSGDPLLLRHTPFLLSHDAASGYLGALPEDGGLPAGLVRAWAQTQSGNLTVQLECGANALDLRPCTHAWPPGAAVKLCHGAVVLPVRYLYLDVSLSSMRCHWAAGAHSA